MTSPIIFLGYNHNAGEFKEIKDKSKFQELLEQDSKEISNKLEELSIDGILFFNSDKEEWHLIYGRHVGLVAQRTGRRIADNISRSGYLLSTGERVGVKCRLEQLTEDDIGDLYKTVQEKYIETDLGGFRGDSRQDVFPEVVHAVLEKPKEISPKPAHPVDEAPLIVEDTPEPIAEPTPEPATEPTPEPATEPTPEPATEPMFEPVAEPIFEPVVEPTPEPEQPLIVEETEEETPEAVAKDAIEEIVEEAVESVTETIVDTVAEAVEEATEVAEDAEDTIEEVVEEVIEEVIETASIELSDETTEEIAEKVVEDVIGESLEDIVEKVVEEKIDDLTETVEEETESED